MDELISRIVSTYNQSHKRGDFDNKRAKISSGLNSFQPRAYNDTLPFNYKMLPYARIAKYDTNLAATLKSTGAEKLPPNTKSEFLLFFYRSIPAREIVAATTGMAWNAVRSVIDPRASLQIAEKILNPRQIVEIARVCLVGSNGKEILYNPAENELYKTAKLYYLIESFQCKIKPTSSFMRLENNKKRLFEEPPIVKVTTAGLLRVQRKTPLSFYPCMFHQCSEYVRGETTLSEENVEEVSDPGFEFLHFVKEAPFRMKDALNSKLLEVVFTVYQENLQPTVYFRHKFLRDYLEAPSYSIICENSSTEQFVSETLLSLNEIIYLLSPKDLGDLKKIFCSTKLTFETKEGISTAAFLVDCLEGEVRTEDGDSYFKVRGMWYKIEADYLALLQQDFKILIRNALIQIDEEGQLPKPWQGNKRLGAITEEFLKTQLDIREGVRTFLQKLKKTKVCYVEKESRVVHQKTLVGEILNNKTIASEKARIETLVLGPRVAPNSKALKKIFGEKEGGIIFKELTKQRPVLNEKSYVLNPFPYPLQKEPLLKGQYERFTQCLEEQNKAYAAGSEDEKGYSRSYLSEQPYKPDLGYLVFDQILSDNIELCDVLYYTETKTWLYHIKETFGQDTRVACSQILNAATSLRSALSTHQAQSYLDRLWNEATKESEQEWLRLVKRQLEALGRENFLKIFQERKIVFVYAFLENPNRSIHKEASVPSVLSADILGISPDTFKALQDQGFLDRSGRLTGKFLSSSQKRFVLEGFSEESGGLFEKLSQYKIFSSSTLAKHDLLHLAQQLTELGFGLEICEIKRAKPISSEEDGWGDPLDINSDALLFEPADLEESESEIDSDDEPLVIDKSSATSKGNKFFEEVGSEIDSDDEPLMINKSSATSKGNKFFEEVGSEINSDDEPLMINKRPANSKGARIEDSDDEPLVMDKSPANSRGKELSSSSKMALIPGDTFDLDGSIYRIKTTLGEGACALHALLGKQIGEVFRFEGNKADSSALAKKYFSVELQKALQSKKQGTEDLFVDILTHYLNAALKGKDAAACQIFPNDSKGNSLKSTWKELSDGYEIEIAPPNKDVANYWRTLVLTKESLLSMVMAKVNGDRGRFKGKSQEEMIRLFREDSQHVLHIIATSKEQFIELLKPEEKRKLMKLSSKQEEINKKWEGEKRRFILSDEIISPYTAAIQDEGFLLNTQEIALAANLYEINVRIVAFSNGEIITAEERGGSLGGPEVVIHHRGIHFERCEFIRAAHRPERADLKEN